MGLFDRIFGAAPRQPAATVLSDDEQAIARYRYMLRTAPPEAIEQALNIRELQTGRRLIQNVQGASRAAPAQLAAELHTLGLTTRERSRSLAQADIAQTNLL